MTKELSVEDFLAIREIINRRSGIFLDESKMSFLQVRVAYRAAELNLDNYEDYLYHLKHGPDRERELQALIEAVAINETSFFREREHFDIVARELVSSASGDDSASQDEQPALRIWSAGCSTGEEAYSLAVTVLRSLGRHPGAAVEIFATDISEKALGSARRGEYSDNALRAIDRGQRSRYFREAEPGLYRVADEVRGLVSFGRLNLLDPISIGKVGRFDIVFCRNVLMYMDAHSRRKVLINLYKSMKPGAALFLGKAETTLGAAELFTIDHFGPVVFYRRPYLERRAGVAAWREVNA